MCPKKDSNAFFAAALDTPASSAIASIKSDLFMRMNFLNNVG